MEMETRRQIDEITEEINFLTSNFQKPDYPFETDLREQLD